MRLNLSSETTSAAILKIGKRVFLSPYFLWRILPKDFNTKSKNMYLSSRFIDEIQVNINRTIMTFIYVKKYFNMYQKVWVSDYTMQAHI